jgi:hypothetical protein
MQLSLYGYLFFILQVCIWPVYGLIVIAVGTIVFFIKARVNNEWPFVKPSGHNPYNRQALGKERFNNPKPVIFFLLYTLIIHL